MDNLGTLRLLLINDWQKVADKFVPLYEHSVSYIDKHKDDFWMVDLDKVLEYERNMNIIRWVLESSTLRRDFKDCTPEEVADDKLNRLIKLVGKRPELLRIINEHI